MTTVDVVIPCYRYGKFLKQCVESVTTQQDVEVRLLIIDDASPDDSPEIAEELARQDNRIEFVRHTRNKGHITTYNEGIEWAKADLFLLLSADDYLLAGALSRAAELHRAHPDMSFAFGDAILAYDDGTQVARKPFGTAFSDTTKVFACADFIKAMEGRNIVPTPTAVVKTAVQKKVGGYSHHLPHAGDMAMWLNLSAEGPVGFVGAPQAAYRMHSHNMSRSYSSARLPDLQQRQAAIEHFLERIGSTRSDVDQLRTILMRDLAVNASIQAAAALDERESDISRELAEFALALDPTIRFSLPWLRLHLHKAIGPRGWQILRSSLGVSARVPD